MSTNAKLETITPVDPVAVVAALERLHATYPDEQVDIWLQMAPSRRMTYVAKVGDEYGTGKRTGLPNAFGHGDSLEAAVDSLIQEAGERSAEKLRKAKIEQLRKQLTELEAQALVLLGDEAPVVTPATCVVNEATTEATALN